MKRIQFDRLSSERRQDMRNLIHNWGASRLPLTELERNLDTLAKDGRPKADKVHIRKCGTEFSFYATYARGNAGRSRAALTRGDAKFLQDVISTLKKQVPGMNDSPEDAKALLDGAISALLDGGMQEDVPDRLQGPLRKALLQIKPDTCQQALF